MKILSEYFCSSEQLKALATVNSKIFCTLLSSNICISYKTIGSIMKTKVCIFFQCRLNIIFLLTQILYPKLNVQHSMKWWKHVLKSAVFISHSWLIKKIWKTCKRRIVKKNLVVGNKSGEKGKSVRKQRCHVYVGIEQEKASVSREKCFFIVEDSL